MRADKNRPSNGRSLRLFLEADLLQGGGRHASHAVKQGQLREVLQQPLVPWQELGVGRVFVHGLVALLSVLQASFGQHQRQTLDDSQ